MRPFGAPGNIGNMSRHIRRHRNWKKNAFSSTEALIFNPC